MQSFAAPSAFTQICQDFPDKIAVSILTLSGAERWSYAKLTDQIAQIGANLADLAPKGTALGIAAKPQISTALHLAAALLANHPTVLTAPDAPDITPAKPEQLIRQSPFENRMITANDRLFLVGGLDDPALLHQMLTAWALGATVLCGSAKLTIAQLPILLRRHDVSLIAGKEADLTALLDANLPALPKLRQTLVLGDTTASLTDRWSARMGHAPIASNC